MIRLSYRYRLKPSTEQTAVLEKQLCEPTTSKEVARASLGNKGLIA